MIYCNLAATRLRSIGDVEAIGGIDYLDRAFRISKDVVPESRHDTSVGHMPRVMIPEAANYI